MIAEPQPIRIGVSACLLGERVRHDGGHKHALVITETLCKWAALVGVCPEVELGLGTPREPVRLEAAGAGVRLIAPASGTDHTDAMTAYAATKIRALMDLRLCGYVFKSGSPSCGLRVPVHGRGEHHAGLFAAALRAGKPGLPVIEESGLADTGGQEALRARVMAYHRDSASAD